MQFREFLLSVNHGAGTENLLFAKNVLSARSFNGKESFAIPVLHRPTCWQIISSLDKTLAMESEREFIGPGRSLSWNPPATSDVGVAGEVMKKSKTALMAVPIIEFQKCFESWIKRWHKCVAVDGEYFQGDNITFDE
ncbi:hypothetical protein ALC60_13035 [Trachymyrmex zeteki]|uniref:Uncharacterized protein n=1 Tax=Mycetomoellerius zeteki TaxID=64791 RepID=A0A151WK67_9HYME|nr:hypothetical protein ALC60_13035 [Trachymyrmex zeteki]